jgi:hypothetical protein
MTPPPSPALLQALALLRVPRGARPRPEDQLPEGVEVLVRIAGGDAQTLALAAKSTREAEATVREAAVFYIQQVMFATGSGSYRVLGLDPGASEEQLKSHHRWLTRWLHPDRNRDEWEAVFSERVNRAWQDLRTSERRQRYDQSRAGSVAAAPLSAGRKNAAGSARHLDEPGLGLSLRWLPHAIFAGLGLSAVAIVTLYYVLRFSSQHPDTTAASTAVDRDFESSALVNPRVAHGNLQPSAPESPQNPAADPAPVPTVEHTGTLALASAIPLPVDPAPAAIMPPAPPAKPAPVPVKQASVPVLDAVTPRREPRRSEQVAAISSEAATPIEKRVAAAVPVRVAEAEIRKAPPSAPVSQREANRIMGRFSEVYADGDLAGMRAMFTPDATSPDGGLEEILDEYDRLFGRTKHRVLSVQNVNWSSSGNDFTIVANYQATLKTGLLARVRSQGKLRLEMRQVNDQWRIYRLEHNERND